MVAAEIVTFRRMNREDVLSGNFHSNYLKT
jgi:hypothetical protein